MKEKKEKEKAWNKYCLLNSSQKLQQETRDDNHEQSQMGAEQIKGAILKQDTSVHCDLELPLAEGGKKSKARTWVC